MIDWYNTGRAVVLAWILIGLIFAWYGHTLKQVLRSQCPYIFCKLQPRVWHCQSKSGLPVLSPGTPILCCCRRSDMYRLSRLPQRVASFPKSSLSTSHCLQTSASACTRLEDIFCPLLLEIQEGSITCDSWILPHQEHCCCPFNDAWDVYHPANWSTDIRDHQKDILWP